MTETLISFEVAKLAKEKGYNQNPYKTANAYGPEFTDGSNVHLRSSSLFNPESNTAVAPTQSLLQKWLREVHKKSVHVFLGGTFQYGFYIHDLSSRDIFEESRNRVYHKADCITYEDALEEGLIEALKLLS